MSLENVLAENTAVMRELIETLKNLNLAQPEVAKNTGSRRRKPVESCNGISSSPSDEDSATSSSGAVDPAVNPEPTANAATPAESVQGDVKERPEISYQDAASAVTKVANEKGRDVAKAILAKFGVAKLPEASPAQYAKIIAACEAAALEAA